MEDIGQIELDHLGLSVLDKFDEQAQRIDELQRQIGYLQGAGSLLEPLSNIAGYKQNTGDSADPTLADATTHIGQAQMLLAGEGVTFTRPDNSPFLRISTEKSPICIDYVVDTGGTGTHTTLAAAMAAAITAGTDATIFICNDISEQDIECGGMGDTQTITILSWNDRWVTITCANSDLFKQTSGGGGGSGGDEAGIFFKDINITINDGTKAVYFLDGGTTIEIRNISFDHCRFSGGYLVRNNDNLDALGNLNITCKNSSGILTGFYQNEGSTPPDGLLALNNNLVLTRWWKELAAGSEGDPSNAADTSIVSGGKYQVNEWMTIALHGNFDAWMFTNLGLTSGCSGAHFRHAAGDTNQRGAHYSNIKFIATQSDTDFGDFQGPVNNPQYNLYVVNIHGVAKSGISPSGTFLTVDSDQDSPYIEGIHAPAWPTVYSGPTITSSIPPVIDHGDLDNVVSDQHHIRYTDTEAISAVPFVIYIPFGTEQSYAP